MGVCLEAKRKLDELNEETQRKMCLDNKICPDCGGQLLKQGDYDEYRCEVAPVSGFFMTRKFWHSRLICSLCKKAQTEWEKDESLDFDIKVFHPKDPVLHKKHWWNHLFGTLA